MHEGKLSEGKRKGHVMMTRWGVALFLVLGEKGEEGRGMGSTVFVIPPSAEVLDTFSPRARYNGNQNTPRGLFFF